MKYWFATLVFTALAFSAEAQLDSAAVSGGSVSTLVDVSGDPILISFLTTDPVADTHIDLQTSVSGPQAVTISVTQFNTSGENWLGLDLELEPDASFLSAPTSTFGFALDSSVSGTNNELANITSTAFVGTGLFYDLEIELTGNTRLTVTPVLVPEPVSAVLLGIVGLFVGLRRGR